MGYIKHEAVIITATNHYKGDGEITYPVRDAIEALRAEMPEKIARLLSPMLGVGVNGTYSYCFAPDGSKEGWPDSSEGDEWRERVIQTALKADEWINVVHLAFGGDYGVELGITATDRSLPEPAWEDGR